MTVALPIVLANVIHRRLDGRRGSHGARNGAGTARGGPGNRKYVYRFDLNDLIAVFDPGGKPIGAALLQRPTSIKGGNWSEGTSNDIYNAWHNKEVSIYRNKNFDVEYLGLVIDDGM